MTPATFFFTGFPGFIASELLPLVLGRSSDSRAVCLVQKQFATFAQFRVREIEKTQPSLSGRIQLVYGDITLPDLGLSDFDKRSVTQIFHLAAVYDLSVKRDLAMQVNVEGTKNVLAFARQCPNFECLQYVSTCYVSGRYVGVFTEEDLEKGQSFNNFYEESKYLAEVEVQKEMRRGLNAKIYRPSIVVGDSTTGATQKYDGPYYVIQWLLRQPRVAVMPMIGDPSKSVLNLVPRDFVVKAISYLSSRTDLQGSVFHLADPEAMTVDEVINAIGDATQKTVLRLPLSLGFAKSALNYIPGVFRLLKIPSSTVDYFVHPTLYATARTRRALEGSGLRFPAFSNYVDHLVEFMREHPEVGSSPMV